MADAPAEVTATGRPRRSTASRRSFAVPSDDEDVDDGGDGGGDSDRDYEDEDALDQSTSATPLLFSQPPEPVRLRTEGAELTRQPVDQSPDASSSKVQHRNPRFGSLLDGLGISLDGRSHPSVYGQPGAPTTTYSQAPSLASYSFGRPTSQPWIPRQPSTTPGEMLPAPRPERSTQYFSQGVSMTHWGSDEWFNQPAHVAPQPQPPRITGLPAFASFPTSPPRSAVTQLAGYDRQAPSPLDLGSQASWPLPAPAHDYVRLTRAPAELTSQRFGTASSPSASEQSQASPTFSDLAIAAEHAAQSEDFSSYPSEAGPSSDRRSSTGPAPRRRSGARRSSNKPEGYVARPPNKFLLFRSHAIRNKYVLSPLRLADLSASSPALSASPRTRKSLASSRRCGRRPRPRRSPTGRSRLASPRRNTSDGASSVRSDVTDRAAIPSTSVRLCSL